MTDADVESYLVLGGTVRYATRDTYEDAERLIETDRHLIEKFGPPRIETHVVRLGRSTSTDLIPHPIRIARADDPYTRESHLVATWPDEFVIVLPRMGEAADDPHIRPSLITALERYRDEWFAALPILIPPEVR